LVGEELDDPHFETEIAFNIEVGMIFFIFLHPKD